VGAVDYEVEYNNRARVPENPKLMAGWVRDAAAYRDQHAPRTIAYGPGVRNTIDVFPGNDQGPIIVFIHGGYWQALDGSSFSHCARGLNVHGISVAIPTYDLCPQVTVDAIIQQMCAAVRELVRLGHSLVISGHSAGGRWWRPPSTRPCAWTKRRQRPRARCSGSPPWADVWTRWSAATKARNIFVKAKPWSSVGARLA
jgi:hypothetical protein